MSNNPEHLNPIKENEVVKLDPQLEKMKASDMTAMFNFDELAQVEAKKQNAPQESNDEMDT